MPRMQPTDRVKEIAAKLIGSSGYDGDVDDIGDLTSDECKQLDDLCFECVNCNWWCAESEKNDVDDEWMCDQCVGEIDAEEVYQEEDDE